MDTKSRKSHKLAKVLIILCLLLPALCITALYPGIEASIKEKRAAYEKAWEEERPEEGYYLESHFVNYAVEASYMIYGQFLEAVNGENVNYEVLKHYGWNNDYEVVNASTRYKAIYVNGDQEEKKTNANKMELGEVIASLTLTFDENGELSYHSIEGEKLDVHWGYDVDYLVSNSKIQYVQNVRAYEDAYLVDIDENQLIPKNFSITFDLDVNNHWIYQEDYDHYISTEHLMYEVGVIWIIIIAVIFVALMALLLPFLKFLRTGWEKLFCIPLEFVFLLTGAAIAGIFGMFYAIGAMSEGITIPEIWILNAKISEHTIYTLLLVLNFSGWLLCFLAEYIVFASIRQFLCGPIYYLKNRCLLVIVLRWCKKKCRELYDYVTAIDISDEMNKTITKIVVVNFVVLTFLCCLWFLGIVGLILYSIVLYIILRKYGKTVQEQYHSILNATNQMAEGDLNIHLENELGLFQLIGESLEKVQQGFEKAVVEEAKSQNMKTELITNVSHDLKTPLTAIITYVDLLKQENITEEEREIYIQVLEQKSKRLKVLIEDLFEVSKAHSGNVTMNIMDVDVVNLMKQVRYEMADQIEASNLQFRWNLPEEKVILPLDGQRTYRVFENLVNNALKYAMPYSRVYADILKENAKVQVMIRNVSAEEFTFDAEHLTDRFVRGDSSRNSEGSGLGLAIAKSFVELQRGEFKIEVDGDLFKVILTWNS